MSEVNTLEIYREMVPESNYDGCGGCHYGSLKCIGVHALHDICCCKTCLVFTSCSQYCEEHLSQIRFHGIGSLIRKTGRKIHLKHLSKKGYTITFKVRGKRYQFRNKLNRYLSKEEWNFYYGK